MENNENQMKNEGRDVTGQAEAAEPVAEKVEQTTEESPRLYTEEELNARVNEAASKRANRREAKIRKEYEQRYGGLEAVLKAGTGEEDLGKIEENLRQFYGGKGVQLPTRSQSAYSPRDIELLASADAEEIIRGGYGEVVEETDRLSGIGVENMTAREKAVFLKLAAHRQTAERGRELEKLGVGPDVYNSPEFADFAGQFNSNVPISKVYELYEKSQPKKEIKTMGTMKTGDSGDSGVKDFYTRDEALKFTKADFDRNPALFKAVENSMRKWKK